MVQGSRSVYLALHATACLLIAAGCAGPFSKTLVKEVNRDISFSELRSNPQAYVGQTVMLGGEIILVQVQQSGTLLEVLEKKLGHRNRPEETDVTGGRFFVFDSGFLDPAVYRNGREVTVIGKVTGQKSARIGDLEYAYPLVTATAIHLWEKREQRYYYRAPPYPYWPYWGYYGPPWWW
ncbi:MAG: Slp family lipoprotein [bacterium]